MPSKMDWKALRATLVLALELARELVLKCHDPEHVVQIEHLEIELAAMDRLGLGQEEGDSDGS